VVWWHPLPTPAQVVLILAGVELFFFIVDSMGLCFGFMLTSVDDTWMFYLLPSRAYTDSRPFLPLTLPHKEGGWGCTSSWEATQLARLTPTDQRDIPCHKISCSAYKAGGIKRKGQRSELWCLPSQVTFTCGGGLLSWRLLNTCLSMSK